MSIDITSTAMSTASAPVSNNKISASSAGVSEKQTTESSFKDEMNKVSDTKSSDEVNNANKSTVDSKSESKKTDLKAENKSQEKLSKSIKDLNSSDNLKNDLVNENILNANITFNSQDAFNNASSMLQNDIAQIAENSAFVNSLNCGNTLLFTFGDATKNSLKMTEGDAQFFLNLTNTNDVSARNMISQAQAMLNSGANVKEVASNFKVSQALLNALSESRQNNQPIRIDFDQNISVILQVNKSGELSARFIPGDKAVEQYLKSNIESLKSTFDEQDLPYSELSYSNSSKQQNKRRREEKQGE